MTITSATVDLERVFKLRLAIARLGEMDNAGWWNTKGLLSSAGGFVYKRGFPTTHSFAQARAVFAVASGRCLELFDAPRCITLWHLPPAVEEQFDNHWQDWLDEGERWQSFFTELAAIRGHDVLGSLRKLALIDERMAAVASQLPSLVDSPSLTLPSLDSPDNLDNDVVTLLAAAFARAEQGRLTVPFMQVAPREGR